MYQKDVYLNPVSPTNQTCILEKVIWPIRALAISSEKEQQLAISYT